MQKSSLLARFRALPPYILLTVVLTLVFIGIDRIYAVQASQMTTTGSPHAYSAPKPQPCGTQLGAAGYSATLADKPGASNALQQALGLKAADLVPEFESISGSATA